MRDRSITQQRSIKQVVSVSVQLAQPFAKSFYTVKSSNSWLNTHSVSVVVLWPINTGLLCQQRLICLYGDKQHSDKLQSKVWGRKLSAVSGDTLPCQVMDVIKLGGSAVKHGNRNLHRWCSLCAAPGGSWAARPRSGHPAWSCHPRPSRRWGAWPGCCAHSSSWSCVPVCLLWNTSR